MESKIKLLEELKLKHSDFEIGTDHDDVDNINKAINEIKQDLRDYAALKAKIKEYETNLEEKFNNAKIDLIHEEVNFEIPTSKSFLQIQMTCEELKGEINAYQDALIELRRIKKDAKDNVG